MTIPPLGPGLPGGASIGAAPFVVTAPPDLALAADRTGTTSFTITNLTGRPVRARLRPRGQAGADDGWFSLPPGQQEIPLAIAATVVVNVSVRVPADAPEGRRQLQLEVSAEDDTEQVIGQTVSFAVPAPVAVKKRKIPWWIFIVIAAVLLLAGGLTAFLLLRAKAPENTAPPAITGVATVGETLTADEGSWSESKLGFTYRWLRCDATGANCAAIEGAQANTYAPVAADVGQTVRVEVTASNKAGDGVARSDPAGPVQAAQQPRAPVPNLIGLSVAKAALVAKEAGFSISSRGIRAKCGEVTDQDPGPKEQAPLGTVIRVIIKPVILPC